MKIHRLVLSLIALLCAAAFVAACGSDDSSDSGSSGGSGTSTSATSAKLIKSNPDNKATTFTVGSKNFTEQIVLGNIYAQALQAAGYTVKTDLNLGDQDIALKALKNGNIDGYPEYTGTALLSFFGVKSDAIPKDPQQAYQDVKDGFTKDGITALPPTPFTSSNEVGVTQAKAKELGITKISDLEGKSQDLTLYGSPECRQRLDCLLGLEQVYGLKFKKFTPIDLALRHEVLQKGQADLSIVFTTDPQNKRDNVVLLQDDKGMFPPYNSTFLVKDSTLEKAGPDLANTVNAVTKPLTAQVIQELNARVDIDKQTPESVAKAYLKSFGFTQ